MAVSRQWHATPSSKTPTESTGQRKRLFRIVISTMLLFQLYVPAANAEQFRPGIYENIIVAVDKSGNITGRYQESQGKGVRKTCSFYFKGKAKGGVAEILTWSDRRLPGELRALKDGVELKVPAGRGHAGCGLVLLPQISEGLSLDLIKQTTWLDLRTVPQHGAKLYAKPITSGQVIGTVPRGVTVGVLERKGEWLLVESTSLNSKHKGWIPTAQTKCPAPPQ